MCSVPVARRYEGLRHFPYLNLFEIRAEAEYKRVQIVYFYLKNGKEILLILFNFFCLK
jgi:hypothetical protein